MQENKQTRRRMVQSVVAGTAVAAGSASVTAKAQGAGGATKKVHYRGAKPTGTPIFSPAVSFGNLVFVSGKGAHFEGDIRAHTKHVLDEIEAELKNAGSSMDKVLKVNVYLNDLKDYDAMNEVYRGRFGAEPPVRTTVAPAGGIPGKSLVEIDCIAYI